MNTQQITGSLKQKAAQAALKHIPEGEFLGVGSGSTVNALIDLLSAYKDRIPGVVAASAESERRLLALGFEIVPLGVIDRLALYIDGADEITSHLCMIKGGGGALTREKVLAQFAQKFICIADQSKLVSWLGRFPLPIEVIPFARSFVARELVKLGGQPIWREGYNTDNGNVILDVHNLKIIDPPALERELNQIPGIVTNGIFALRPADTLILATPEEIKLMSN